MEARYRAKDDLTPFEECTEFVGERTLALAGEETGGEKVADSKRSWKQGVSAISRRLPRADLTNEFGSDTGNEIRSGRVFANLGQP